MTKYIYNLPSDEQQVQAEGLVYGFYDAMQDFPKKTLRTPQELIAQAHRRCDEWSARPPTKGKSFCNDLQAFKHIFTGHYVGVYTMRTGVYDQTPEEHQKDVETKKKLGWERFYLVRKAMMMSILRGGKV